MHAASSVYVEFSDHDRIPAPIVGWDVFDDVGVLRIAPSAHALVALPLGRSAPVVVGEPVAAIGSPLGNADSLAVGVVSAVGRSIAAITAPHFQLIDAIQTDAPIAHGSSGGPLLDAAGRVIGINAQIRSDQGNGSGIGFAVPIGAARRSLHELLTKGRVTYAYAGLQTENLTPALARHLGLPVGYGALIDSVTAGGPAARAGLRGGSRERAVPGRGRPASAATSWCRVAGRTVRARRSGANCHEYAPAGPDGRRSASSGPARGARSRVSLDRPRVALGSPEPGVGGTKRPGRLHRIV